MKRFTVMIGVLAMTLTFFAATCVHGTMYPHPEVETKFTVNEEGTLENNADRVWKTIEGEVLRSDMECGALRYFVYLPENYDSNKEYPILVYLHGGSIGYHRGAKITPWSKDLKSYSEQIAKGIEDCIILAPQAPGTSVSGEDVPNSYWSGLSAKEILGGGTINKSESSPYLRATQKLMSDFLEKGILYKGSTYKVDASRVYLAGHSQGAVGSFMMLKDCPDVFAAAIIGAGIGDPDSVDLWKDTKVRIYHGKHDNMVDYEACEIMAQALKDYPNAEIFPLEYADHDIKPYMYTEENFSWMAEQDRDAIGNTRIIVLIVLAVMVVIAVIILSVFIRKRKVLKK